MYSIPEMLFPGAGYLKSAICHAGDGSEKDPMQLDVTVSQMDSLMLILLIR